MDPEGQNIENMSKSISIELKESSNTINSKDLSSESEVLKIFCPDLTKINDKDECDWTPLYRSIISGNLKASEALLNHGADPNIQCSMNETALYQAVDMEKIDHVKLLLKHGSDPNISQIDGLSPLHLAVSKQNLLIIKYLLKYKANPNKQSSLYKQTPVHLAIKNNVDSSILLILVNSGGLLNIKDKFGKTPVDYINSEEMKKTIVMIKPEKNKENIALKKIYFTPSKKSNLVVSSVISKTIRSESPAPKEIHKSNTITLKDSGKAKFNFIEIRTGSSKKKENTYTNKNKSNSNNNENIDLNNKENIDNNINLENKENEDMNIKVNLFNPQNKENEQENKKLIYSFKKAKYYYKEQKFDNINNKYLNNSSKNNYIYNNYIESPIQEESSSYVSSNKYFKNKSNFKNKNGYNATLSPTGEKQSAIKKIKNNTKSQTASQKKYIRKKSNDKISCFKCESNKKIKTSTSQNLYYEKKIMEKSMSSKNIQNSRNIDKIFLGEINNTYNTNSLIDALTSYRTHLTTNSNKGALTDRNSLFSRISENNYNYSYLKTNENDKRPYNRPKIVIKNSNNFVNNMKEIKEKKISFKNPFKERVTRNKNRNKNLFNSKTARCYPTYYTNKTLFSINSEQNNAAKLLNNFKRNNKENISFNMKQSLFSDMTDISSIANISTKNNYNKNSQNSSQSKLTYYTLTRNANNSLLEIIEKTNNSNIIIHYKESLPIYNWLKEIDLLIYLSIFLKKKIYSLQRTISDLRHKKVIITPNDIRNIGITIPGHIYRIFTKLELDAGLIDKQIYDYLIMLKTQEEEKFKNRFNKDKDGEESSQSIYECGGCTCCSLKRSHVKIRIDKKNNVEINPILNLDKWLININMYKYKQNFIKNGFDKIEFFILQMFSSIPLEEKIFEKEMNIDNNNDIDLFILQLNKDVKIISNKFKKKRSASVDMDKNKINKYLSINSQESEKKLQRASSYSDCSIF